MSTEATTKPVKRGQGDFFAIDARTWASVCALGMNPAVAYLVLACFSARDNTHTAASVQAIEKYTGVARSRARDAIQKLIAAGLVRQTQEGTKPRYELIAWAELPGTMPTPSESELYQRVVAGKAPTSVQHMLVDRMTRCGWLKREGGRWLACPLPSAEPDRTWLPNTFVRGAAAENPPLERMRQTADVMALRLSVDLYHAQNLRDDGGINRGFIFKKHERTLIGERREWNVWGFESPGVTSLWWGSPIIDCHRRVLTDDAKKADPNATEGADFFARLKLIEDAGLLHWVPFLCDSEKPDAEPIIPLWSASPIHLEAKLARAASEAAKSLLIPGRREADVPGIILVPVRRHQANVALASIGRLAYRPRTRNTSEWAADMNERCQRQAADFAALAVKTAARATG